MTTQERATLREVVETLGKLGEEPSVPTVEDRVLETYDGVRDVAPAGYQWKRDALGERVLREPKDGEWFLPTGDGVQGEAWPRMEWSGGKRLILKPIPPPPAVTVRDVYGTDTPTIPAGYRWTEAFRSPQRGETYLNSVGEAATSVWEVWHLPPRYILEPIPAPTVESIYGKPIAQLIVPTDYELTGEFRIPKEGEITLTPYGDTGRRTWLWGRDGESPRLILRDKPPAPTVESVYGKPLSELTPPKGWEWSGKFRCPRAGEHFMYRSGAEGEAYFDFSMDQQLILRRKPAPPTVEQVYGKPLSDLSAPEGWEFTGEFRVTQPKEYYLSQDPYMWYLSVEATYPDGGGQTGGPGPRLLLRKRPPAPPKPTIESVYGRPLTQLVPPKGWRWKRVEGEVVFQPPVIGNNFMTADTLKRCECGYDYDRVEPRLLLERAQRLVMDILDEHAPAKAGDWVQYRAGVDAIYNSSKWTNDIRHLSRLDNSKFDRILSTPRLEDAPCD